MKVAVGVWGSCLRFKNWQERWSGQSEYVALVKYLLECKEVDQVILIGKNDGKYSECPILDQKLVSKKLKGVLSKADVAYVFQSQGAACISTIPGYRWVPATKDKPYRRTKVLSMAENYAAPITDWLNRTKTPWVYIATDPRYIDMIKPADLTNHPALVISGCNGVIKKWTHAIKYLPFEQSSKLEYKDFIDTPVHYGEVQKLNLNVWHVRARNTTKIHRFGIVVNKILDFEYRARIVPEWVTKGAIIYGNLEIPGFKSIMLDSASLDDQFSRTKYTLVIPLYNHGYGKKWVTYKPYEMILLGVIPFLHPDYDQDNLLVQKDHFIRVNSKEELEDKMNLLDSKPKLRTDLMQELLCLISKPNIIKYAKKIF